MTTSWLYPENWAAPAPDRMRGLVRSWQERVRDRQRPSSASWNFSDAVSPLNLYCYLKTRFGPPNGFMMSLRSPSVDNFCHWNYTLSVPQTVIDLLGLNLRTEIRLYDVPASTDLAWADLEKNLIIEFEKRRADIQRMRDTLERWHLFINPYRRLTTIADHYGMRLVDLDLRSVVIPTFPKSPSATDFARYREQLEAVRAKYTEGMSLSLCLQMIAPVMGEAAVNLFMLLLAKPELKADRRLYEDFLRRNIDVRIKSLPLSCVGFPGLINGSEEPFKDFLRLMNRRNDTLHGNVDAARGIGDEIFFDFATIPLVLRHRSLTELALDNALASVNPEDGLRDVAVVKEFVEFLVSRLEPPLRPLVTRALQELQLGYRLQDGRVGVILPGAQVDFIPGASFGLEEVPTS